MLITGANRGVGAASKAACLMLALDLREELRDSGATVTVVLPGFIDTDMGAALPSTAKAPPAQIAALALDGWLAGQRTTWPDRFAELVPRRGGGAVPCPAGRAETGHDDRPRGLPGADHTRRGPTP